MNKNLRKRLTRLTIAAMLVTSSIMPAMAETIKVHSAPKHTHKQLIGKNRYETGVLTAKEANKKNIIIVNGATEKMVDGLCASALVDKLDATVLPIDPNNTNSDAKNIINNAENVYIIGLEGAIPESFVKTIPSSVNVTRIGGTNAISEKLEKDFDAHRIAGATRYETNKQVLKTFYSKSTTRYFTNGETLIDALSGASLSKYNGITFINKKKNLDLIKDIDTVQIGGLPFNIEFTDKEEALKPDNETQKPDNNKPSKPSDDENDLGFDEDEIIHGGENEGDFGEMGDDDTQVGEM